MIANPDGSFSFPREKEYVNPSSLIRSILSETDRARWDSIPNNSSPKRIKLLMQYPLTASECYQELKKGRTPRLRGL